MRHWYLVIYVVLLSSTCSQPAAPSPYTLLFSRVVDLSHVVRGDMPHLPGVPLTQLVHGPNGTLEQVERISLRSGTSLTLLAAAGGAAPTVDQLTPYDVVAPAVVLDVRDQAQDAANYALSQSEIAAWEERYGEIPADALVLVATGWDMRWGNPDEYLNLAPDQTVQVPGIGADAAALLASRQVRGVGLDAPLGPATTAALVQHGGAGGWFILENLTSVEQVPATGATLVIGLVKVQGSYDSPARVLALIP